MILKYGPQKAEEGLRPVRRPFAASQIFHELGGALGFFDGNGRFTLGLTATATLFGYALLGFGLSNPRVSGTVGSRVFTSSSTAGETKELVKPLRGNEYVWMPGDAAWAETMRGNACDLIGVNNGTKQLADVGTSSTDVLLMHGGEGTDIQVTLNPAKIQADT